MVIRNIYSDISAHLPNLVMTTEEIRKFRTIIEKLFKVISSKPRKFLTFSPIKHNKYRSIADYISGMTDRFAINIYKSLK